MPEQYQEEQLRSIAGECREFEHVIVAMGYGASWANVSEDNFVRRCNDCVHWSDSNCDIFQREISQWV